LPTSPDNADDLYSMSNLAEVEKKNNLRYISHNHTDNEHNEYSKDMAGYIPMPLADAVISR